MENRRESLSAIFTNAGYHCGELLAMIDGGDPILLGLPNLEAIKDMLNAFQEGVVQRGSTEQEAPAVQALFRDMKIPVFILETFFQSIRQGTGQHVSKEKALEVATVLEEKVKRLRQLALQLDASSSVAPHVPEAYSEGQEIIDLGHLRLIYEKLH